MEPTNHIEPLRLLALLFYGFTGSLSVALIYLYVFTWGWNRRVRERLTMVVKCAGFIIFSVGMMWANWNHLEDLPTLQFWIITFGVALVDIGWMLRTHDILSYIRDYKTPVL